jgi:hypothetical protein
VGAAIAVLGELGRFARVRNTVTVRLANAPVAQLPEAREAVVAPESEPTSPADEPSVLR